MLLALSSVSVSWKPEWSPEWKPEWKPEGRAEPGPLLGLVGGCPTEASGGQALGLGEGRVASRNVHVVQCV